MKLVIIYDKIESFFLLENHSNDKVTIGGNEFLNTKNLINIGFYDWLRDDKSNILGVRLIPFPDADFSMERFLNYPNTRVIDENIVEIFFSEYSEYSEELSDDQCFNSNIILYSESEFLLSFDLECLDDREKQILEKTINPPPTVPRVRD